MGAEVSVDAPVSFTHQVKAFFGTESPLREAHKHGGRQYEERPQQKVMAEQIAACLEDKKHLLVEAPTGVGKSFAYLVPAIYLAKQTRKPVVISTHTIALQEQLMQKDIPLLRKLMDDEIFAAIAKGRQNYVCLHRLSNCQHDVLDFLPDLGLAPEINKIARWAEKTQDGSLADLGFKPPMQLWGSVCSEAGVCPRDQNKHSSCFFQRSRRRLHKADIIVANHAILCADLAMRRASTEAQGLLPDYSAVIIDEAHTFEGVAATHLGMRFSTIALYLLLNRLMHPKTNRGLLSTADPECREAAVNAHDHCKRFFQRLLVWLEDQEENPLPYEHAGHIPNLLSEPLTTLGEAMTKFTDKMSDDDDVKRELESSTDRIYEFRDMLDKFLGMEMPDSVYWFERFGRDRQQISLNAVPVEVNNILDHTLFGQEYPVVLTSATMAVDHSLAYFKERLGCPDAEEQILDTPFNYAEQVELYLPESSIPDPRDSDSYLAACCRHLKTFINMTEGKAFVLFTNYSTMNTAADLLVDYFDEKGYRLLVQGREYQRSKMLEIFREDTNSVIFGTDSFWMGVDVPGESLSNVILTRLPFPVPSHPLISAICDRLEQKGMSSFRHYSLPEAILKFRQGFGRLIRSQDDTGIVVVLDPRILTKFYGRSFINSLPVCRETRF